MASSNIKAPSGYPRADQDQVSARGRRRRRIALVALFLLMMLFSFLLGRETYQPPAPPVVFDTPTLPPAAATTPTPAPKTLLPAPAASAPAPATIRAVPASSLALAAAATQAAPVTNLLEVSVGTRTRGGLTLKFDQPVSWALSDNLGKGDVQVDIQGVHNLDTFPRNLPLPPGVKLIHAGIVDADTLHLRFILRQNVRAFTAPTEGPSTLLSLFFRTAAEGSAAPALPQAIQSSGGCGSGTSAATAKAIALLQRSLDRNPGYADVRTALILLETCTGDGSKAEQLLAQDLNAGKDGSLRTISADAALRFARGDMSGALLSLRANMAVANGDPGYAELLKDLQAAAH